MTADYSPLEPEHAAAEPAVGGEVADNITRLCELADRGLAVPEQRPRIHRQVLGPTDIIVVRRLLQKTRSQRKSERRAPDSQIEYLISNAHDRAEAVPPIARDTPPNILQKVYDGRSSTPSP